MTPCQPEQAARPADSLGQHGDEAQDIVRQVGLGQAVSIQSGLYPMAKSQTHPRHKTESTLTSTVLGCLRLALARRPRALFE